jgi:hypothetical protein
MCIPARSSQLRVSLASATQLVVSHNLSRNPFDPPIRSEEAVLNATGDHEAPQYCPMRTLLHQVWIAMETGNQQIIPAGLGVPLLLCNEGSCELQVLDVLASEGFMASALRRVSFMNLQQPHSLMDRPTHLPDRLSFRMDCPAQPLTTEFCIIGLAAFTISPALSLLHRPTCTTAALHSYPSQRRVTSTDCLILAPQIVPHSTPQQLHAQARVVSPAAGGT